MTPTPSQLIQLSHDKDVFVSYAPADADWVEDFLIPRLTAAGISVYGEADFAVGAPRLDNVARAVDRTRHTLAVMTPAWLESGWNDFETLLVQTDDPANRRRRLLPLMLKRCLLPRSIGMLEYADLTQPDIQDEGIERVLTALAKRANIFVAYVPVLETDSMLAHYLGRAFQEQGHNAHLSAESYPGMNLVESRRLALESSDYVVVLLSEQALGQEELLTQLDDARRLGKRRLLPVRVDFEGSLPPAIVEHVADRSFAAWRSDADPDDVARLLLNSISRFAKETGSRLGAKAKLWPNGAVLRIGFMDGTPEQRLQVVQTAGEWMEYANVRFRFTNDPGAPLRVSFQRPGSWAFIGDDALQIPPKMPTINFGLLNEQTSGEHFHQTVLHEFGHVLGLIHEHQMPNAEIPWDRDAVEEYYTGSPNRWTPQQVEENIFRRVEEDYFHVEKEFDPKSIMIFPIANQLTRGEFEVGRNRELSPVDKEFVGRLYPAT